ncbi:uncharacterized protein OCT59_005043 [Rhizophagus irregularis]|uniref:uncharacterized protein n=1 Tax=Rhizophagus irregularis TaxID=588596 RepID=UPI0033197975|nr:hypothetical protein OCT59_005043 [Rhizophagus irregularis]
MPEERQPHILRTITGSVNKIGICISFMTKRLRELKPAIRRALVNLSIKVIIGVKKTIEYDRQLQELMLRNLLDKLIELFKPIENFWVVKKNDDNKNNDENCDNENNDDENSDEDSDEFDNKMMMMMRKFIDSINSIDEQIDITAIINKIKEEIYNALYDYLDNHLTQLFWQVYWIQDLNKCMG